MENKLRVVLTVTALISIVGYLFSAIQAEAASGESISVGIVAPCGPTCLESWWTVRIRLIADTDDFAGRDYLGVIGFDANNNPIFSGVSIWFVNPILVTHIWMIGPGGWINPPSSRPWTFQIFDLTTPPSGGLLTQQLYDSIIASGAPMVREIVFDPAAYCPDCITLGTGAAKTCDKKKQYFMYTLRDDNQPSTWQPYCYIISNNGIPSVESQAHTCSVPGYDHVFRATNIPYGGWVSTDCNGNPSYGWPDWQSSWYRPQYGK